MAARKTCPRETSKPKAAEALCGAGPAAARGEREASVRGAWARLDRHNGVVARDGLMKRRYERTWSRWRIGRTTVGR